MKILFLVPEKTDATCFYRASGIAYDLQKQSGHEIETHNWAEVTISWHFISKYDLIMLQRPFTDLAVSFCEYAKAMSKPLWVDYDDNLFVLNPENKAFHTYNNPKTQECVKKCLEVADIVTVPNEYLRQSYMQFTPKIKVIPNAFNDSILHRTVKKREDSVLWRGPESHIYDLMAFGQQINMFIQEFPANKYLFMGYYPWFLSDTDNKTFVPGLDIIMYHQFLQEKAPKIVHLPLHDNLFNRCRSNIGYIEGTFAGAACVVPGWWNVPGAAQYNNAQDYYEAMKGLLSGELDTERMNKTAWEYITDCLMLSKINKMRVELIKILLK